MIIFSVIDIAAGQDSEVWNSLTNNLDGFKDPNTEPLVANHILEKGDIALVSSVKDSSHYGSFLIDQIRSVKGVRDIETFYLYEARWLTKGEKAARGVEGVQAYIFLSTEAGKDRAVFKQLSELDLEAPTYPRFLGFTFHREKFNIMLSVNSRDIHHLHLWTNSVIRTIDGVDDSELMVGMEHHLFAKKDRVYPTIEG